MAAEIAAAGYSVCASDIADWGYGRGGVDFLASAAPALAEMPGAADAIVTNPPFDQAVPFVLRALGLTKPGHGKVAMLQRHEWDAAAERRPLFGLPFAAKLVLHKRPRWSDEPASLPRPGATPRFPYAWYLWDWTHTGPPALRYLPDPDKPARAVGNLLNFLEGAVA